MNQTEYPVQLWELQDFVADLLRSSSAFASLGIKVLVNDGTYPKLPERETALQAQGIVLIVWTVQPSGLVYNAQGGAFAEEIYVPIVVEELEAVNSSETGANLSSEQAVQYVQSATIGTILGNGFRLEPFEGEPFSSSLLKDGLRAMVANIVGKIHVRPGIYPEAAIGIATEDGQQIATEDEISIAL